MQASDEPGIALVLPSGWIISGVVTWATNLATGLRGRGHRAVLIEHSEPRPGGGPQPAPLVPEAAIIRAARRQLSRRTVALYSQTLPATVIPNWGMETYAVCARIAARNPERIRLIGVCHADEPAYYDLLLRYEPIIHRFVAVSRECADMLVAMLPHRRDAIVVRACGVAVPRQLERSYSPAHEPIRLMYASRIEQKQKRVLDLVRLAEELEARGVAFTLTIAGTGPSVPELRERVGGLAPSLRERIDLRGALPPHEIPELLRSHDVAVLVSAYEGTAVFMLEALAQGCVPVVTKVSGTSAVIDEGRTGHSVAVGDMARMAQAVVALAADRARLATMGRAAHASARRFSHEDYADWLVQLHREIWRERPRPWPALRPALPVGYRLSCMGTAYYMLARHKVAKALGRPLRES